MSRLTKVFFGKITYLQCIKKDDISLFYLSNTWFKMLTTGNKLVHIEIMILIPVKKPKKFNFHIR